jgi:hypothetical protein
MAKVEPSGHARDQMLTLAQQYQILAESLKRQLGRCAA